MNKKVFSLFFILLSFGIFITSFAQEDIQEIQNQIKNKDKEKEKLEQAIKESEALVEQYSGESESLKKEIANLNYLDSKLRKNIYQKEIDIKKISEKISTISEKVELNNKEINNLKKRLRDNIFAINQFSSASLFEKILAGKQLSDITDDVIKIETIQRIFQNNIKNFSKMLDGLEKEKQIQQEENTKLEKEKEELSDKKFLLEENKKDKDYLLKITKNEEEKFKSLLYQQRKDKEEFEKELFELESKLKFILDRSSVPEKQVGLFAWPTPKKSDRISQFFGYTDFHSNYETQKKHNGIDVAVPTGTNIYSVMSGTVLDTGDSTKICRKKQYGKWIAIDHGNGLTSMYAHLSKISVKKGDRVNRREKIGLAGNTGYSFGSHLHFTVYYTAGLKIKTITKNKSGCYVSPQKYKLPLAPLNAYVNPFNYLEKPIFSRLKPVKLGDSNIYVRELQNMLTYVGIYPKNLDIDGAFGPQTEKYLKIWKEKNKISGDGKTFSQSDLDKFKKDF